MQGRRTKRKLEEIAKGSLVVVIIIDERHEDGALHALVLPADDPRLQAADVSELELGVILMKGEPLDHGRQERLVLIDG